MMQNDVKWGKMSEKTLNAQAVVHPDSSMGYNHIKGNKECTEGWCGCFGGSGGYPKVCSCGGLIHADFGDENSDGDYWLYTKCDTCGEPE
ncbi:MAG: hypothetical protein Q8J68_08090 [Methanolobus sp.]|uniref:hypothetical protein n=1 Tax=Methanolobus sp. TaxID=1874737 RepID=UPI00272F447F|nr:hypothetical protein [Methanolobus sp.]MDP2217229.1 hypothetical protein [Methanolobus sp.]